MSAVELDPIVKSALKLLHSPNPDSAEKIRQSLDELIRQRYGSSKMLINTINKKYISEETTFPGTIKRQKSSDSRSSASGKNSSPLPPGTCQDIAMSTETVSGTIDMTDIKNVDMSEEENLKEFGDLACVVCGAMVFTAGNRLVECADCHSLYHQECHKPQISDDDANEQEFSWCCTNCKNKVMMAKTSAVISVPSPSKSSSSHSSSSSSSSSPYYKNFEHAAGTTSKAKSNSSKSSNSSSSSKAVVGGAATTTTSASTISASGSGSNSKSAALPSAHFNVISVDRRLQIMKKKAAKQQESKRSKK